MGFNDFTKKVGTTFKKAGDKIDNTVEIQKIKYKISKKQEEIDKIYWGLGKSILEITDGNYAAAVEEARVSVSKIEEEITALNSDRTIKENKIICENCGTEVSLTNEFCPKCGTKVPHPESTQQ